MSLHSEIFDQPACLKNILNGQKESVKDLAREIKKRDPGYVFLAARGTSDNAGRYANYLWGAYNQLPLALATPSLFSIYGMPPRLRNAMVVGVSQSGQSPDIVGVLEEGKKQGCLTVAITNEPKSPLAQAADQLINITAGVELSTAATKTYTNELMAIAMISAALSDDPQRWEELERVGDWAQQVLALDEDLKQLALRYRYMQRCVVLGRGFNYCTAFEWSLKMKEMAYIIAEPYSSADFLHGPVAMMETGFPVMCVLPSGAVFSTLYDTISKIRTDSLVELAVISDSNKALDLAQVPIPLPKGIPEWLSPIISIIPAQLFCYHLTFHKGINAEKPRNIQKVTETK